MARRRIAPYLVVTVLACNSSLPPAAIDAAQIDAPSVDAGPQPCTLDPSYTYSVSPDVHAASVGSGSAHVETFIDALNEQFTPDVIDIELHAGFGTFAASDLHTGTVALAGDELDANTCGACVFVGGDFSFTTNVPTELFIANSGTIDIVDVGTTGSDGTTTGAFSATITNVGFTHISRGSDGSQVVVDDGCTTMIGSATLTASLQ